MDLSKYSGEIEHACRVNTSLLGASLLSILMSTSVVANHGDEPASVALVGNLQLVLGCPADWQPECVATELIKTGELWQTSFLLPAGHWEYKVALNDTWDESYGNNGNNIAFTLLEETSVTFSYNQESHSVSDNAPRVIAQPNSATLVGNLQDELGCVSDWQPECLDTALGLDDEDLVWQKTVSLAADSYEYKIAIDGSWDENYGANALPNGANISLVLTDDAEVKFYYDHESHWITSDQSSVIATIPGNFQAQLGCSDDWKPDCLRTWLKDEDGDGIYTFSTTGLVAGNYEGKVAINESWDENYGQNGQANGPNISFNVQTDNELVTFVYDALSHELTVGEKAFDGNLSKAKAYWLTKDTLAWDIEDAQRVELHYSSEASLSVSPEGLSGGEVVELTKSGTVSGVVADKFRHLTGLTTYTLSGESLVKIPDILKSQFALYAVDADEKPLAATGIQPPGVLDDIYAYDGNLGIKITDEQINLRLWAPTAQSVKLHLFDDENPLTAATVIDMEENSETGVWHVNGEQSWLGQYYLFEVNVYARSTGNIEQNLVTDPYSVSLSMDSKRSQIIDLKDPNLKPRLWDKVRKRVLRSPEEQVMYELHVRDFTMSDSTVPENHRGKFKGFTHRRSQSGKHLRNLSFAGVSTVHLLPSFDCATIPEDPLQQSTVPDLTVYAPDSTEQQAAIEAIRTTDGFNWCYDPFHFTVPEGSYSTNPNGTARILEFREMVHALNKSRLRVVMDVVYNHTSGSLQGEKSVLDKIVPDYYHRLNSEGDIEMSSCCANTATEHHMMEKLMLDSLKTWAVEYKIDGFRFDLMGHHSKENILKAKAMLQSLTMKEHGVDGSKIYLYGEGWNFGEVVNNTRFEQASQQNMGNNTGVGSFNDYIRDAVRGGGPFDTGIAHVETQGFINGQYYDANAQSQASLDDLLRTTDRVRMSLAGTLSDYEFMNYQGQLIKASSIGGYTSDPQEAINYIAAHDNETLFDANQYKLPLTTSAADRARVQNLGNDIVAFSQGIPFFHAGQEMMRSKSMDRNSYDAGDWFNLLDFSYEDNGWGRGLPLQADNEANWSITQPMLANPDLAIEKADIKSAVSHMREIMLIRKYSPLFKLKTAQQVIEQVAFHNTGPEQVPGVIVMSLSDSNSVKMIVVFNVSTETQIFSTNEITEDEVYLHPFYRFSLDPIVKQANYNDELKALSVPARTTAVFLVK